MSKKAEHQSSIFEIDAKSEDYYISRTEKIKAVVAKNAKLTILFTVIFVVVVSFMVGISAKFQQQNAKIESLTDQIRNSPKIQNSQRIQNSPRLDFLLRHGSAESCKELQEIDHEHVTSGYFYVDPDGRYNGLPAFEVFCDFQQNVTKISTTSMPDYDDHWHVEYKASVEQIVELITASGSCYQTVQLNCPLTPVALINEFFWMNRNHCSRYLPKNETLSECQKPQINFTIESDWMLPITGVGVVSNNFTGNVTVGDLICSSKPSKTCKSVQ